MDSSNVGPRKTPDQIPFWLDPKYDQYDFAHLFLHGLRYDRYDLRFFRRHEGEWMDPTARQIWEAMISDEEEPRSPKKPTWPGWVDRLFWRIVRHLLSEDVDWIWPWLEGVDWVSSGLVPPETSEGMEKRAERTRARCAQTV